jgi:hypothetical protein
MVPDTMGGMCGKTAANAGPMALFQTGSTGGGQSHDHTLSANFVGGSTSTLSPYLVLIYIIKT